MNESHLPDELIRSMDLSVGYDEHLLFKELNISLYRGQLVCFMGPNGSGKSTLIRTFAGLQLPLKGTIQHLTGSLTSNKISRPENIALVLTDPVSAQNMTVYELITFGRYPYLNWNITLERRDKDLIENAIQQVNINHLRRKRLFELSDGQLQLSMIARALAQDTPIIILDEPTAHLDLNNRVEIMKLLRRLTRETGKAILLATHELDLALQTADIIWLIGPDKNIITGIPEDLVLNGAFDETFQFKGFDLKTGKVQHEISQKVKIRLVGEGYNFLWTKNALERNGYGIHAENYNLMVTVEQREGRIEWTLDNKERFISVSDLLTRLQTIN